MPPRLISTLTRPVVAAARAASAAAATSVITLRLPIGSSSSARDRIWSDTRMTSAGARAASTSAAEIATDLAALCSGPSFGSLWARPTAPNAATSRSARFSASSRNRSASRTMPLIRSAWAAYLAVSLYRPTMATRAAAWAACRAAVAPPPGVGALAASSVRKVSTVFSRMCVPSVNGRWWVRPGGGGRSAAQTGHLRVDQRLCGDRGSDASTEVVDLDAVADAQRGRQPGVGDRPADGVPEFGARDIPGGPVVHVHRFRAQNHAAAVVDGQAGQPAGDRVVAHAGQRVPTDEGLLARADREAQAGLVRVVLGGHVGTPGPVTLLQPQTVERGPAGGDDAVPPAGRPQHVPEALAVVRGGVQLPAQLAHVGQPHRGDRNPADANLLGAEVLQALVGEVVGADGLHDLAGQRSPQPDAAGAAGDVADLDRTVRRRLPTQVVQIQRTVRADLEQLFAEPGDGDVAADPTGLVEKQRVGHRADGLVHLSGGDALQQIQGTGPADLKPLERCHVVHGHRGAGPPRLGCGDGGVELRAPGVAGRRNPFRRKLFHQRRVGLVPVRPLPAGALQENRAELQLPGVERTHPQVAGRVLGLQRVQDVVDLHEVL